MKVVNGCRVWTGKMPKDLELSLYKSGPMTMTRPQKKSDQTPQDSQPQEPEEPPQT